MSTKILFIDRDGTMIEEPEDFQIDSFEKLRFVKDVIPALLKLREAGYQFVIVSNQDGLGTERYPQGSFDGPHRLMLQVFESQGVTFREELIDRSFPEENLPTRKPGIGLAMHYLRDRSIDLDKSAMVGDRETDNQFAKNMGIRAFQLKTPQFGGEWDWAGIAHELADAPRTAKIRRKTKETDITVEIDLDRAAEPQIHTGLPFFDHMLEQIGKHGGIALSVRADGDLHIDEHHTVEDTALALGQALKEALGDKRGIGRYGFVLPMDEALAQVALDISGRAYLVFEGELKRERVGDLPTELVPHFFRSLSDAAGININVQLRGENDHHMIEGAFKALARALREAVRREGTALPSTKGVL
jgi:imidazoleglycerol-phosphate dehydratase/histidinol-phosphatase